MVTVIHCPFHVPPLLTFLIAQLLRGVSVPQGAVASLSEDPRAPEPALVFDWQLLNVEPTLLSDGGTTVSVPTEPAAASPMSKKFSCKV